MAKNSAPTLDPFLVDVAAVAADALQCAPEQVRSLIKPSADPTKGDYAIPCFPLAKAAGKNPAELATEAAARVSPGAAGGLVARAEAVGPYLNVFLDAATASERVVAAIISAGPSFGSSSVGAEKVVVIDFSSPNIAKHLAFHHIRSTMIGNSLGRILRFQGYEVHGLNFLGDWGMSFAKLIVAIERYGVSDEELAGDTVTKLGELYVRFSKEAENLPELDETARETFTRLEQGDEAMIARWQFIRDASMKEFLALYERLGVSFEDFTGEAAYDQASQDAVIERLAAAGLTSTDDEGRLIVDLTAHKIKVPCILRKSDGASLYATRDLAAVFDRQERFSFDQALYVVDMGQSLHFKQWFKVAELLGGAWAKELHHLPFGVVTNQEGGRLRSREGGAVLLADVLDEAVARTRKIIEDSDRTELETEEEIAEVAAQIGIGAVVFNDLKTARVKDVKFNLDEIVSVIGYTAPYIQYAHARICGIFRKAQIDNADRAKALAGANLRLLVHDREQALVRELKRFGDIVARAGREHEPSCIAGYLHELATELSRFYSDCKVLCEDDAMRLARLSLVASVGQVLANGLHLLGIGAPERI